LPLSDQACFSSVLLRVFFPGLLAGAAFLNEAPEKDAFGHQCYSNDHANFIIIVVRYLARLAGNPAPSMAQKLTFSADLRRTPKGP